MRVVVLKTQQDARSLKAQLLPAELDDEKRAALERDLKVANPHLDLDKLERGDMVLLPDEVEVEAAPVHAIPATDPARLAEKLTPIQGSIRQTIALEADEREVLRRDLRGKTMKAAADADPKLAADLERLRERLTEDAKDARDREERVASLIEKASTDLADLRRSFGL